MLDVFVWIVVAGALIWLVRRVINFFHLRAEIVRLRDGHKKLSLKIGDFLRRASRDGVPVDRLDAERLDLAREVCALRLDLYQFDPARLRIYSKFVELSLQGRELGVEVNRIHSELFSITLDLGETNHVADESEKRLQEIKWIH